MPTHLAIFEVVTIFLLCVIIAELRAQRRMSKRVLRNERRIMSQTDDLKAAVERESSVSASAITLLQGLSKQLSDALAASGQPNPEVQAVIDRLNSDTDALATAVTANTPAAPAA